LMPQVIKETVVAPPQDVEERGRIVERANPNIDRSGQSRLFPPYRPVQFPIKMYLKCNCIYGNIIPEIGK